jgi:proteasome lid subunit RPN8/RPN11
MSARNVNARLGYNILRSRAPNRPRRANIAMISPLALRIEHQQTMLDHVRGLWPEEACGLLAGAAGQVEGVYLVENIRHSRSDYFMDPQQQVTTMLAIEAAGWDLCGIFHSHPAGQPQPSATDIDRAYYPDAVYIILAPVDDQAWAMRGFTINEGLVREVPLEIRA